MHLCLILRLFNAITKQHKYLIAKIDDILRLGYAKGISTLDETGGYHQIPMNAKIPRKKLQTERVHYVIFDQINTFDDSSGLHGVIG